MDNRSKYELEGYRCGHLISKPLCPYIHNSYAENLWEKGYKEGKEASLLNLQLSTEEALSSNKLRLPIQEDLGYEFEKVLRDNAWDLYES